MAVPGGLRRSHICRGGMRATASAVTPPVSEDESYPVPCPLLMFTKTFRPDPISLVCVLQVHLHSLLECVILLSLNALCSAKSFCLTLEFFLVQWQGPGPHYQDEASLGALCQHPLCISEAAFAPGGGGGACLWSCITAH